MVLQHSIHSFLLDLHNNQKLLIAREFSINNFVGQIQNYDHIIVGAPLS